MIHVLLHIEFGLFDAHGDFHLLLACEQGNLPHLLEIHPHRVVENVEFLVRLIRLIFLLLVLRIVRLRADFVAINLRGINDVNFHAAHAHHDGFHVVRIVDGIGQVFVEVVESEVTLLLRELHEFTEFFSTLGCVEDGLSRFQRRFGRYLE